MQRTWPRSKINSKHRWESDPCHRPSQWARNSWTATPTSRSPSRRKFENSETPRLTPPFQSCQDPGGWRRSQRRRPRCTGFGPGASLRSAPATQAFCPSWDTTNHGGVQREVSEFLKKFRDDPTSSAINYESLKGHRNPHVRTVRIDQKYRAVVLHPDEGNVYVLMWVDRRDEAMDWAKRRGFEINPRTGAFQTRARDLLVVTNWGTPSPFLPRR